MQDRSIECYGKRIANLTLYDKDASSGIAATVKMDVGELAKDVAAMGRLLRAGFDMHFTNLGHTCWMERAGQVCEIYEDDPNSEAPNGKRI